MVIKGASPSSIYDPVDNYISDCVSSELRFVREHSRPDSLKSGAVEAIRRHILQFYWTVTRALGLSRLHNGFDRVAEQRWLAFIAAARVKAPLITVGNGTPTPGLPTPRLLVDVTAIRTVRAYSGIQRVVSEFVAEACRQGIGMPIVMRGGPLLSGLEPLSLAREVTLTSADCVFLLDASWAFVDDILATIKRCEAVGAGVAVCIYDIVPLEYPALCRDLIVSLFTRWFEAVIPRASVVLCISDSTAEAVRQYIARTRVPTRPDLTVTSFPLGVTHARGERPDSREPGARFASLTPYALTVGTLEPRKGHSLALDAFDTLWCSGYDLNYVIVGRRGWSMRHVEARILAHPQYGRRLFWFDNASDADLCDAYRLASVFMLPSVAEGFGLPVIEAAEYGIPLVLSDIPIFREVAGPNASFFPTCDAQALADALIDATSSNAAHLQDPLKTWTWDASVSSVVKTLWSRPPPPTTC